MRPNVVETVPKVLICEVGPRDGLQSVTATMPTRMVKKSQTPAGTVRAPAELSAGRLGRAHRALRLPTLGSAAGRGVGGGGC